MCAHIYTIAHTLARTRAHTHKQADKLVVLKGGAVVEQGTHAQLIATKPDGVYAQLVRNQIES